MQAAAEKTLIGHALEHFPYRFELTSQHLMDGDEDLNWCKDEFGMDLLTLHALWAKDKIPPPQRFLAMEQYFAAWPFSAEDIANARWFYWRTTYYFKNEVDAIATKLHWG